MTTTELAISEEAIDQAIAISNDQATSLKVVDTTTYEQAGVMLKGIKALKANIQEYFKPLKDAANKAHKAITQREAEELAKLAPAMEHLSNTMSTWNQEQDRLRRIEQARLEADARKLEEDRRIAEALLAEKAGDKAEAEAILSAPVIVAPPIVQSAVPKVAGLAMRSTWKYRIVNEALIPREYLTIDAVKIGGVVRALKGNAKIPGIEVYEDKQMTGSR
jgi:reverse gyrase